MNALAWNCRGLGQARTVQELVRLVRNFCPKVVFLSETRQSNERVSKLRWRLGLKNFLTMKGDGSGGDIALLWDEGLYVDTLSMGHRHFDVIIKAADDFRWRCTFMYGEPRTQDRHLMWEQLRRIKPASDLPWLMMGDFNEVCWSFEHFSARRRPGKQMSDFKEVLAFCDLHDIGFCELTWTYDNRQQGDRNVRVRLDCAVASAS